MEPTVSIVLPTYNRGKTLKRAVDSVLNQTFKDFELIIVDDRSTDDTHKVLREYCLNDRIRIVSQLNRGCAAARNIGIGASRGRYIAFQDSDDEWMVDKLETAVAALESCAPEVGVFYSDMLWVEKDGSSSHFLAPPVQRGVLISEDTLDYQVLCIGIQSAVIRRECFVKSGLFDESLMRFIDLELFIRLSDHFEFFHCEKPLVKFFASDGISTNQRWLVLAREYLIEKYRARLERQRHHLTTQQLHLQHARDLVRIAELRAQLSHKQSELADKKDELSSTRAELADKQAELSYKQAELAKIKKSLGWRLLSRYGQIKYRYLLPIYRLLGAAPTDGDKSKG